jgi:hypothetical protein
MPLNQDLIKALDMGDWGLNCRASEAETSLNLEDSSAQIICLDCPALSGYQASDGL